MYLVFTNLERKFETDFLKQMLQNCTQRTLDSYCSNAVGVKICINLHDINFFFPGNSEYLIITKSMYGYFEILVVTRKTLDPLKLVIGGIDCIYSHTPRSEGEYYHD